MLLILHYMFFKKQAVKLKKYLRKTLYFIYLIIWINFTIIVVLVLRFAMYDLRGARWKTEDSSLWSQVFNKKRGGDAINRVSPPLFC